MEPIKEFQVGKVTVKILPDDTGDQECPLDFGYGNTEQDGVIFATWERRSNLTDKNPFKDPEAAQEFAKEKGWKVLNLFKYDHSAVAYRATEGGNPFHCPWDSGQCGYVLVNEKEFPDSTPLKVAEATCETVTTWCNGWYYGFVIEDEGGDHLDSCWGFDDADYCESEARSSAEHYAEKADEAFARELEASRPDLYGANNVEA